MSGPKLIAELGMDGRGYEAGLRTAGRQTENFAASVTSKVQTGLQGAFSGNFIEGLIGRSLGGIGLGAVVVAGKQMSDALQEQLKDIKFGTLRTGLDSDTFQRISNVLKSTEVPAEAFSSFLDHIAMKQQEVKAGGESGAKALREFGAMGISAGDATNRSFQELGVQIFRNLQGVELTGEKVAALRDLGGRSAVDLVPAAQAGLDSVTAQTGILSPEFIKQQAMLKASGKEANAIWADVGNTLGKVYGFLIKMPYQGFKALPTAFYGSNRQTTVDRIVDKQMEFFKEKDADRIAKQTKDREADEKAYGEFLDEQDKQEKIHGERSHATASEQLKYEEQILNIRLRAMTPKQKEAELQKQIAGHLADAKMYQGIGMDYEAAGEMTDAAKKGIELANVFQQSDFKPVSDSLSSVGGFTGFSGESQGRSEANQKVQQLINMLTTGQVRVQLQEQ
jgi:hypothetical protein